MKFLSNIENLRLRTKILAVIFISYTTISIICTWSEYQNIFNPILAQVFYMCQIVITPILFCLFFTAKPSLFEVIMYFLCLCISIFTVIYTRNPRFFMFILFFFGAKDTDYIYILKHNLIFNVGAFLVIVISSLTNILPNVTLIRNEGILRQSLGFSAPNLLIIAYMIIVMQIIIVRRTTFSLWDAILLGLISLWLGKLSDGRGGELSIILGILLTLIISKIPLPKLKNFFLNKIVRCFLILLPEFFFLIMFSLIITIPYGSNLYNKINLLFSFRFDISHFYFENLGIHLLPVKPTVTYLYPWFNGVNNAVAPMIDNLYIYLFSFLGVVATFIYLFICSILINNALKNEDYWLLIVLISFLFLGFVESQMVSPFVGIFVITFSRYGLKANKEKRGM